MDKARALQLLREGRRNSALCRDRPLYDALGMAIATCESPDDMHGACDEFGGSD